MAVTGPQLQPGVLESWGADLAYAVEYAKHPDHDRPLSAGMYGGGSTGAAPDPGQAAAMLTMLLDAFTNGAPTG